MAEIGIGELVELALDLRWWWDHGSDELWGEIDRDLRSPEARSWFGERHSGTAPGSAAYFCMEFALSEALPIYSGGLGNVAGDQLKAASDLGVPIVGVGLVPGSRNSKRSHKPMRRERMGLGSARTYVGEVPASRPASHYRPRVVPHHALARVPMEAPWILWQDRREP